ncbi:MAG: restriction endonuclease subunit S [Candidatus Riflebacteria bacterium]
MKNWKEGTLSDLVIFQRGFDITKAQQSHGIVPIISSSGVSSYHNKAKCKAPGVITGRKGTLGKVFFAKEDYWPHDTTLWVKDFKNNDPKFTYYFLKLLKMETYDVGASNPTLNRNHLHKLKISLPLPKNQRKIAAVLSAYDDLIENNNRRIAILEKMAEELYREWFVRLRFPGHEKTKISKGIPEGWEVKRIGDVVLSGGIETGKRPKGGAQESGIPSIGAENVDGIARYDFSKEKFVCEDFFDKMQQGKIQDRDILFYKDGAEIGKVSLFQDNFPHQMCCVNEHVFLIRVKNKDFQYFLYFSLARKAMFDYIQALNKNAAQPGINKAELNSIPLVWPNENLILLFNKLTEPLIKQLFVYAKSQSIIRRNRDKLLSRLMSGKIDLENLDIQFPASMQEDE